MSVGSFDFSDVVDEAVDRSGGETSTAADVLRVRRGMRMLTERWAAQGFNTWRIATKTFTISGTAQTITLGDDVDDVIQVNSQRQGLGEQMMRRISPSQYAQLTTKDSQGQPSQYYLDRRDNPVLFLFPIGTPGYETTILVYYVQRPENFERYGDTTDDVPGRWLEALISGLALDLARKRPPYNEELIARLKVEAADAEDLAQRADRGRQRYRYRTSYAR